MPSTARSPKKAKAKKAKAKAPKPPKVAKVVRKRKVVVKAVEETPRLVCYYLEGWRYGYREGTKGGSIIIQPIGALGSLPPRKIRVPADDVREV